MISSQKLGIKAANCREISSDIKLYMKRKTEYQFRPRHNTYPTKNWCACSM